MSSPRIEAFLIDDDNEEEFAAHRLTARQVREILENTHVVSPNRKHRRGLYLVVGKDNSGICIATPVEPTHEPWLWRPITAWPCKQSEKTLLEKGVKYHEKRNESRIRE